MTLATRCPACGTSFRVVQDQLKVSAGWVRCGRCNEVFNAIDALFEIDSTAQETGRRAALPEAPAAEAAAPVRPDGFDATPTAQAPTDAVEAEAPAAHVSSDGLAGAPSGTSVTSQQPGTNETDVEARPTEGCAPSFVLEAERAARWRRPGMRLGLSAAAAMLCVTLAAQVVLLVRDPIAARWPASRPLLDAACNWAGCRIEPLRRIGALAVESSGLTQLEGTTIYRLAVVLRNRSELELMLPALDLVLTDSQGQTLARRVLTAAEFGRTSPVLAGAAELSLQANLNTGDRRVSGYTIEIFYP